ncbi:hypothetical protein RI129_003580 [Pyrocoelia pectoralis]|uniref:BSD domain-containing protein n=1 Tax=Pyrocoelia pectoralis TaxID=417401 RepID=A0AAN7VS38_9COLE
MGESSENGWLSSWLSAAKNKSTEVFEFVKKDLEEFGTAVKNEASSVVSSTGTAIEKTLKLNEPESTVGSMKRSFSSFLGQMNTVLNPSPDDSDTEAILITEGSEAVTLSKLQQIIYELQKNEKTFMEEPGPSLDKQYQCWLEIIDNQLDDDRLNRHLVNSTVLNTQYQKLVPEHVSHQQFWKRYLFRKALLEDELARQEAQEKREQERDSHELSEKHLQWDTEDFATDIELSEEEQTRLLQEYDEETKQKNLEKRKSMLIDESVIFQKNSTNKSIRKKTREDENKLASENETKISRELDYNLDKRNEHSLNQELNENAVNDKISSDRKDDYFNEPSVNKQVSQLKVKKADSSNSIDLETKSSNSSSDGDWEKIDK